MTKKHRFLDDFKAKAALNALRGDNSVQEIAAKHKMQPTQVTTWNRQAIDGMTGVFSGKIRHAEGNKAEGKELNIRIGRRAVENILCQEG